MITNSLLYHYLLIENRKSRIKDHRRANALKDNDSGSYSVLRNAPWWLLN